MNYSSWGFIARVKSSRLEMLIGERIRMLSTLALPLCALALSLSLCLFLSLRTTLLMLHLLKVKRLGRVVVKFRGSLHGQHVDSDNTERIGGIKRRI